MYYNETNGKHHIPHIHVRHNNYKIVYDFNANVIDGKMPLKQKRMVEAWIMIHKEELITLWNILQEGKDYFKKVEPYNETVIWENGEDVCPEDLYYKSKTIEKVKNIDN